MAAKDSFCSSLIFYSFSSVSYSILKVCTSAQETSFSKECPVKTIFFVALCPPCNCQNSPHSNFYGNKEKNLVS